MSYSQVGIVNLALTRIGTSTIASMAEDDEQARVSTAIWEYIRDEVLADHRVDWTFAKTRAALVQSVTAPVTPDYAYLYAKPTDILRVLMITPDGRTPTEFALEGDYILSNIDNTAADVYCLFIKRITDPTKYPPHFAKSLALRLAIDLAYRIKQSSGLKNEIAQEFEIEMTKAAAVDRSNIYVQDENGSTAWAQAGREWLWPTGGPVIR